MKNKVNGLLNNNAVLFLLVFALIFARYCAYGFQYYHQLDDYIQFHDFLKRGIDTIPEMMNMGMFAARPVASLGDNFIWSRLSQNMILAVMLMSALHAASAVLLKAVWSRHFGLGHIFIAVYALLPLGFEGTYWMSAASRVVVGLFLASLALFCFEKWCAGGKKPYLILFMILELLAYGCYEQAFLFSAASVLLLGVLYFKSQRRRSLWALWSFANAAVYFAIVLQLPTNSVYAGRMEFVAPTSRYYFNTYLPDVLDQLGSAFLNGGFLTIAKGFKRGVLLLIADRNLIYLLCILSLTALFFAAAKKGTEKPKKPALGILIGLLLAAAPLLIFLFISNSWFSLRNTVMSYCGIAIVADIAITAVFSRLKARKAVTAGAAALIVLVSCISSVSELHDYRETEKKDRQVVALLAETLQKDGNLRKGLTIGILNVEMSYLDNQNFYFHDHIKGVTSSDWALHGALEWQTDTINIPTVVPLPKNPMYEPWNYTKMRLGNYTVLYLYDGAGSMIKVTAKDRGGEKYDLYDTKGKYLGYTWEEDKYGYLVLNGK